MSNLPRKRVIQIIIVVVVALLVVIVRGAGLGDLILAVAIGLVAAAIASMFLKDEESDYVPMAITKAANADRLELNDPFASQIGHAWQHQRAGASDEASQEFEQVLQQDPDNIDACYGMGLAQRTLGKHEKAVEYFQHALSVVDVQDNAGRLAREMAASDMETARIKPNTAQDDRYMMLTRMLKQRIAETKALYDDKINLAVVG